MQPLREEQAYCNNRARVYWRPLFARGCLDKVIVPKHVGLSKMHVKRMNKFRGEYTIEISGYATHISPLYLTAYKRVNHNIDERHC